MRGAAEDDITVAPCRSTHLGAGISNAKVHGVRRLVKHKGGSSCHAHHALQSGWRAAARGVHARAGRQRMQRAARRAGIVPKGEHQLQRLCRGGESVQISSQAVRSKQGVRRGQPRGAAASLAAKAGHSCSAQ